MVCNILDIALILGLLVILDLGSVSIDDGGPRRSAAVETVFLSLMLFVQRIFPNSGQKGCGVMISERRPKKLNPRPQMPLGL